MSDENRVFEIPLAQIKIDPTQPRKYFDQQKLCELADSIKEQGLIEPVVVKANGDGSYVLSIGERRFRACKIAGLQTVKCLITTKSSMEIQDARVTENLVREDLSDMELAKEFQRSVEAGQTHEQIAHAIKKSRAFVTQRLSLLRLPEERQEQLEQGKISFADARVIVATSENAEVEKQHGYTVTMEQLEVYRLFHQADKPSVKTLYQAYRKDLATIRRALA